MKARIEKPIDNVTVELLDVGLRFIGVNIDKEIIDKIIDLVELIEDKGYETSINDLVILERSWDYLDLREDEI